MIDAGRVTATCASDSHLNFTTPHRIAPGGSAVLHGQEQVHLWCRSRRSCAAEHLVIAYDDGVRGIQFARLLQCSPCIVPHTAIRVCDGGVIPDCRRLWITL